MVAISIIVGPALVIVRRAIIIDVAFDTYVKVGFPMNGIVCWLVWVPKSFARILCVFVN